jgi:hypothetical protein
MTGNAPASRVRVVVTIERDSEPIQGTVTDEAGHPRPFCGWLELVTFLEQARTRPLDPPPR